MLKILGLCGRSGSGKSYVCKLAVGLGFAWIDADRVYAEMMQSSPILTPCKIELMEAFGADVIFEDGSLNRPYLSNIVFNSNSHTQLDLLNQITHKYIINAIVKELIEKQSQGFEIVILDAPTLFESRLDKICDAILSVTASDEVCLERIMSRDNLSQEKAKMRLSHQMSNQESSQKSDFVIDNSNPTKDELISQLLAIYNSMLGKECQ